MKIKIGLSFKFILLTTLLIIITSLTLSLFFLRSKENDYTDFFRNKGIFTSQLLSNNSEYGVLTQNTDILIKLIQGFLKDSDIIYAIILNNQGTVLAKSIMAQYSDIPPQIQQQAQKDPFKTEKNLIQTYTASNDGIQIFDIATPIITRRVKKSFEETELLPGYMGIVEQLKSQFRMKGKIFEEQIGIVRIGISTARINKIVNQFKRTIGLITLLVSGIGILITIFLVKIIIRPIKRLVYGTRQIARGDLSYEVRIGSRDEIGELAKSFNQMTFFLRKSRDQIEEYSRKLEEMVEERTKRLEAAEAELIRSEKFRAIGELITGMTHELNNKLTPILGYVEVFRLMGLDEKAQQIVDIVEESALAAKKIVESLLKYSRPAPPKTEYIDLNEVLEKTLNLIAPTVKTEHIKLHKHLDEHLPKTIADGSQISQAFLNILNNACQEIETKPVEHRKLEVKSHHDEKKLYFTFIDSGRGISKENLIKIFDPFFSTKEVGKGTGLGLSISYGIIQAHKGTIHVESKLDKGTTFTIELPIKKTEHPH